MQAYIEKEDSKKLKQKQRERMQPKMGKMDIDYQVYTVPLFFFRTLFPVYASSPKNDLCTVHSLHCTFIMRLYILFVRFSMMLFSNTRRNQS